MAEIEALILAAKEVVARAAVSDGDVGLALEEAAVPVGDAVRSANGGVRQRLRFAVGRADSDVALGRAGLPVSRALESRRELLVLAAGLAEVFVQFSVGATHDHRTLGAGPETGLQEVHGEFILSATPFVQNQSQK